MPKCKKEVDKELIYKYFSKGVSINEICKVMKVSATTVKEYLTLYVLEKDNNNSKYIQKEKVKVNKEELYKMFDEGLTILEIHAHTNISKGVIKGHYSVYLKNKNGFYDTNKKNKTTKVVKAPSKKVVKAPSKYDGTKNPNFMTEEEKEEIKSLIEQNINCTEISNLTGIDLVKVKAVKKLYTINDTSDIKEKSRRYKEQQRAIFEKEFKNISNEDKENVISMLDKGLRPKEISMITGIEQLTVRTIKKLYVGKEETNSHVIAPDSVENFNIILNLKNSEINEQNLKILRLVQNIQDLEKKVDKLQKENRRLINNKGNRGKIKIY